MTLAALLDFLLNAQSPLTLEDISKRVGRDQAEVEKDLEKLLQDNHLRKRIVTITVTLDNGTKEEQQRSIYWTSSLLPFVSSDPIITTPFKSPFDYGNLLERLTDQRLQQEKLLIQTKLRKLNTEYENLLLRSKRKISDEDEQKLEDLTKQWLDASRQMLYDILSELKQRDSTFTMAKLLNMFHIDFDFIKWNAEEECFDE